MGATAEDVLVAVSALQAQLDELKSRITISGNQVVVHEGLSDIDDALGTIIAGEFRAGVGAPGHGFSGTRMVYPTVEYDGQRWSMCGVENDKIQWGARSSDGKFMAGAGMVTLSYDGIDIVAPYISTDPTQKFPMNMRSSTGTKRFGLRLTPAPSTAADTTMYYYNIDGHAWLLWAPKAEATITYPRSYIYFTNIYLDASNKDDHQRIEVLTGVTMNSDIEPSYFKVQQDVCGTDASVNECVWEFNAGSTATPGHAHFNFHKTQTFELTDADTTSPTSDGSAVGWVKVKVGSQVGYVKVWDVQ